MHPPLNWMYPPGWLPHNKQSSKLDQGGGNRCLTERVFVVQQQFCPRCTISSKLFWVALLVGWVASCLLVRVVLYNPPPAPAAWLESRVWTLGPNSNTWFLSPIFTHFSAVFGHFCLRWLGFLYSGWWHGVGDGVPGDSDEEGGEAEHKAGRNISGWFQNQNVILCEIDNLISEKRRGGRNLGWNNHKRWAGGDLWNVWGEELN